MSISLIKLKNGVELIGDLIRVDDNVLIEHPMQVNYTVMEHTTVPVISFTRYCPFSAESIFQFDREYVLHITPVKKAIEDYYIHVLDYYKNVTEKYLENEFLSALTPKERSQDEVFQSFLKKVKIHGYKQ
jgi:hypothetical protein